MQAPRAFLVILLIVAPAFLRMLTFEWNVVPIGALALFCGCHFRNRALAFGIPLLSMFLGDVLLAVQTHNPSLYLFHTMMPFVYGCYAVSVFLGIGLHSYWSRHGEAGESDAVESRDRKGLPLRTRVVPIALATVAGSVLFFLVTNFGDWLFFHTYAKTFNGLIDCYVAGLPFFRGTLGGDLVGSAILFGGEQLLRYNPMAVPESNRF